MPPVPGDCVCDRAKSRVVIVHGGHHGGGGPGVEEYHGVEIGINKK